MQIIGCDFHPSYQQIAWMEKRPASAGRSVGARSRERHGGSIKQLRGQRVRVGMEAVGNSQWFEQMLEELGHELWIGEAATDSAAGGAEAEDRPTGCATSCCDCWWTGGFRGCGCRAEQMRDVRQLLRHRQKMVELRSQVKNQLQHLALNQGVRRGARLWSRQGRAVLEQLPLQGWTARRRSDLLAWLDRLERQVGDAGPRGERGSGAAAGSAAVDDPSGRGTGGGVGVCADLRTGEPISARQAGGQLSGTDPAGAHFGWPAEAGTDQQARQHHDAHAVGGSGAECGARFDAVVAAGLPPAEGARNIRRWPR